MFDAIGYEVAVDALNDPDIPEKEKTSWQAYKFYCQHGYNPNVDYELHNRLGRMMDIVVEKYGTITEFLRTHTNLKYSHQYWHEAYQGALIGRGNSNEVVKNMIKVLNGLDL